jgi:hypothetical protein
MGATLTGAAIRDDKLDLVQVGDSRAYWFAASRFVWRPRISHWYSNWLTLARSAKKKPKHTCFVTSSSRHWARKRTAAGNGAHSIAARRRFASV